MFVSLFQIRRQHIFDPFHECADSARQITPMCYVVPQLARAFGQIASLPATPHKRDLKEAKALLDFLAS
jgi:hypothetical protein